ADTAVESDAGDKIEWITGGNGIVESPHREPDSEDSESDSEPAFDTTVQIRRPTSFEIGDKVVPSIAINLDPPTRKRVSPSKPKEKTRKPLPLKIDTHKTLEDDESKDASRGRARKSSFGQESCDDVTALGAMKNKILRRKQSPHKDNSRSQLDLIQSDVEDKEKEKEKERDHKDKEKDKDKMNPARKAKHKLDTRVSKIKAEVAKVEGYIKGSSATHDSSAPSSYPSSVVS